VSEKIRIGLEDWQFNAGIVGLCNILRYAEDEYEIGEQYIEFDERVLNNFEAKYYDYLIDTYEKTTNYYEIQDKLSTLLELWEERVENKDLYEGYLQDINTKLNNSPYKKIRKYIPKKQLNIKNINLDTLMKLDEMLKKEKFEILKKECIGYYNQQSGASNVPKAIIDKYINTNMLNLEKTCKDVSKYIKENKSNSKLECFICGNKIKKGGKGLNFLLNTYFDIDRKKSHVWNLASDIEICPICELVYYCIPAGFVTVYGKGLFINSNTSLKDLIDLNTVVRTEVLKTLDENIRGSLTYRALITAINKQDISRTQYKLQDVQIIRYENNRYRFNILSKDLLRVIRDSQKDLEALMNAYYREGRTSFNIYDIAIDRLFNNYNMFTLIHKLLMYKLTESDSITTYYNMNHVMNLNYININYLKGVEGMEKVKENRAIVKDARTYGYHLRKKYLEKDKEADKTKIRGISYRMLNALKTRNAEMFMHNVITSYMYIGEEIPSKLTMALESEEELGIIGYAFVTGLNGYIKENDNENGGDNYED
jgi:CRISPR-associated protein Cst1